MAVDTAVENKLAAAAVGLSHASDDDDDDVAAAAVVRSAAYSAVAYRGRGLRSSMVLTREEGSRMHHIDCC